MVLNLDLPQRLKWVLYFVKCAGKIEGKTKFQKMVFLLGKEEGLETGHDYQIYTYGPYSQQLSADLEALQQFDLISVDKSTFDARHSEFVGKQFIYSLTKEGQELVKTFETEIPEVEKQKVCKVISEWNNKDLPKIIEYVYGKYMPRK